MEKKSIVAAFAPVDPFDYPKITRTGKEDTRWGLKGHEWCMSGSIREATFLVFSSDHPTPWQVYLSFGPFCFLLYIE